MKLKKFFVLLLLLGALAALTFGQDAIPGQILVKFRTPTSWANYAVHRSVGARVVQKMPQIGVELVQVSPRIPVERALERYRRSPAVVYAEPNYRRYPLFRPNDSLYSQQYAPIRTFAEQGWDITRGDPSTIIAVIDTGIQLDHPDLRNKIVPGYDFSDNDSDPSDSIGHGTHCSGIAAADTNNGMGIAGMGFNCMIMPLKIFPNSTSANVILAVLHATDHGAKVISMSIGSYFASQAEDDAMKYAVEHDVLPVAAAGNDNVTTKLYPAGYDSVLAVGSTDQNDQKSGFSNWGDWVDVAAPGSHIYSTYLNSTYVFQDGTSMATPCVAGYAGLLYSHIGADATAAEVRAAIENNCDDVGTWLKFGRINVARGLADVVPPVETEFPPEEIEMYLGTSSSGDVPDVLHSDSLRFSVRSTWSSLGQVAGAGFSMTMGAPLENVSSLSLEIEANGPAGGTGMVWLFNWNTNQYDFFKAFPLYTTDQTQKLRIYTPATYVSSTGEVRGITRAHVPLRRMSWSPFTYAINEVKLSALVRNR
ncbi:MAG: S8 family peptidase [Fimbriimonadaceae bacterium]|nr:peptidase S8 [Chthonomonadaceae bacterium]MCO5295718.1 S8 family peptidase [Fimbriimonadaceae bacterium]